MFDICCIGHLTLDKVVTPGSTVYMAGGTSFYFSNAVRHMPVNYCLVTSLAEAEMRFVDNLREKGTEVTVLPSRYTVCFENIYSANQDHRTQRVSQQADAFDVAGIRDVNARVFHLGPLLANDISPELIRSLAARANVSLDVQGYLRDVRDGQVYPIQWAASAGLLPYVHTLKANDAELEVLTGETDLRLGAKAIAALGVKEVVITLGSQGSLIYENGKFHEIAVYMPRVVADATGCGDTYMAGYLSRRLAGAGIREAGEFASAMASIKIESSGPFTGTFEEVAARVAGAR
ncbi:PfkB family carbohydrate kinase [Hufsiella ginkgonis]|uniref:Ribokinase n=1 Tax=Hufsiella ginkgonis TaxID=2695274 RepID=A0A7K1XV10_9SPHI|nr:PfkB family carbohydrate kinase [Hufsiella ginkgonis]MXV14843.1 ribokinase [Hufsiella ginkgonis]